MKKIALILALVMVFAVALVACDNTPAENSTPATESSVPADESKVEDAESSVAPEASEDEVSEEVSDEVSEPADEESKAPAAEVGELISVGKTYTISEQFRMGGQDVNWGWDPNAAISYPDEEGKSLTDGVKDPGDSDYTNAVWAGFSHLTPSYETTGYNWVNIDLGETTDLAKVSVTIATNALDNGIGFANTTFEVFVSEDGENWTSVGSVPTGAEDDTSVNFKEFSVEFAASAKYVELRIVRGGWAFISEVEVYAAAE